jgi:hypothetical protein
MAISPRLAISNLFKLDTEFPKFYCFWDSHNGIGQLNLGPDSL